MNAELIERLAVVLAALELPPEELAAVVVEDCRNRAPADDWDATDTRVALARLIVPDGWGVCPHDHVARDQARLIESNSVEPVRMTTRRMGRCGAVSSLALGPSVCQRHAGHDGPHVEADTSWMEA